MKPTIEQQTAIDTAVGRPADDLKIEAFAGAGKTTTLKGIAESRPGKGLYLAFNRAIKDEAAAKFPGTVNCKTAHGLAFGPVGKHYADRLSGRILPRMLVDKYNLPDIGKTSGIGLATYALRAVSAFCQSGDAKLAPYHFPQVVWDKPELAQPALLAAQRLWADMEDLSGTFPVSHDFYLKKWALGGPRLYADYILFDEAQDANGVMLSIVCPQQAQKIYVGDRYQQIYSWRRAVNAMETIQTPHLCRITQSFRFGQEVADAANAVLNNLLQANVEIKGIDASSSILEELEEPDAYLFRTNGCLIGRLVSLLEREADTKIAVTGGTRDLIALIEGAEALKGGRRSYLPELAAFDTWRELCEYAESEIGGDLAPLVRIMEGDVRQVKRALERCQYTKEHEADITLSTAHKSKGREWANVKLANDFQYPGCKGEDYEPNAEEYNLLYVAVTRAREVLDVTDCEAYEAAIDPPAESKEPHAVTADGDPFCSYCNDEICDGDGTCGCF